MCDLNVFLHCSVFLAFFNKPHFKRHARLLVAVLIKIFHNRDHLEILIFHENMQEIVANRGYTKWTGHCSNYSHRRPFCQSFKVIRWYYTPCFLNNFPQSGWLDESPSVPYVQAAPTTAQQGSDPETVLDTPLQPEYLAGFLFFKYCWHIVTEGVFGVIILL